MFLNLRNWEREVCTYRRFKEWEEAALAGVTYWIEHHTVKQKVTSAISSHGTWLGCGPGPQLGVCKRQPYT